MSLCFPLSCTWSRTAPVLFIEPSTQKIMTKRGYIVSSFDSSSRGSCQNPLFALNFVTMQLFTNLMDISLKCQSSHCTVYTAVRPVHKMLEICEKVAQKFLNISKSCFMVASILIFILVFIFTYLLQNVAVNDDWASNLLK